MFNLGLVGIMKLVKKWFQFSSCCVSCSVLSSESQPPLSTFVSELLG